MLSFSWLALLLARGGIESFLPVEVAVTSSFAFGVDAIYFSLLDEIGLPKEETGAAVGMASLIGYSPDIFFNPFAGHILDHYKGQQGYSMVMAFVANVGIAGLIATRLLTHLRPGRGDMSGRPEDIPADDSGLTDLRKTL